MSESITRPPSMAVLEAVAERDAVDVTDLETPLNDVIDPEALDDLFRAKPDGVARDHGTVTFSYEGYTVSVRYDDSVVLEE